MLLHVNRAPPDTWLVQRHLPYSGSVGYVSGDCPFSVWTSPVLFVPLLGVWFTERRERGWVAGGISLRGICLGVRSRWLRGRLQVKAPGRPSSPSSCSSSPTKNHFKDHNIYHELYYGRLFFRFKNKRWLRELYLVYGSRLHVNVLIGQLLYLRCRVSPQQEGAHGSGMQKGPPSLPCSGHLGCSLQSC